MARSLFDMARSLARSIRPWPLPRLLPSHLVCTAVQSFCGQLSNGDSRCQKSDGKSAEHRTGSIPRMMPSMPSASAVTRRFQSPHRWSAPSPACSEHLVPRLDGVMPEHPPPFQKGADLRPSQHWFGAGRPFILEEDMTIARC